MLSTLFGKKEGSMTKEEISEDYTRLLNKKDGSCDTSSIKPGNNTQPTSGIGVVGSNTTQTTDSGIGVVGSNTSTKEYPASLTIFGLKFTPYKDHIYTCDVICSAEPSKRLRHVLDLKNNTVKFMYKSDSNNIYWYRYYTVEYDKKFNKGIVNLNIEKCKICSGRTDHKICIDKQEISICKNNKVCIDTMLEWHGYI